MRGRILVVDDEVEMLVSLKKILSRQGFTVEGTTEPEAAIAMIATGAFDLLLTDLKMPGMDGVELLKRVKQIQPDLIVIILTGYARVDTAVAAMKEGAFDYLEKPFSPSQIELVVRRALSHHRLETENLLLRARIEEQFGLDRIVGKSPEMLEVFELVRKVARSDMNVLVIGESGTGKELIANAIHLNSARREKPFIPVDCGAIVGTLMESELFGYVKGSFTGANTNKRGLIEMADGGTLFLDELGELSPSLQVKLLRTLQERKFRPVGGSHFVSVDIRIVGATNRNLREAVKAGTFREDLYHRLN
ncbi:MAG: sigma-54-dependent Fis family transcriptional regulator, partial [Deltaproteobacteria bacterium]